MFKFNVFYINHVPNKAVRIKFLFSFHTPYLYVFLLHVSNIVPPTYYGGKLLNN